MTAEQKKSRVLQLGAALLGLSLLGILFWKVGIAEVAQHLYHIGWLAPLVLIPQSFVALFDAKGWGYTMGGSAAARQLSLLQLSLTRLAGEAINNLTPTANVGGEAVKVYLLRQYGVTSDVGTASVVAAKTALTVSQVAFIVLGLPFFLYRLDIGFHAWWIFGAVFVMAYGFVMGIVRWQQRGLVEKCVGWLRRRFPGWSRLEHWQERAQHIDAHLFHLYDGDAKDFIAASLYHFLGWAVGAVEVYVFLILIGTPVSWMDALIIETMIQPVTAAALIIPGALGVREAGGVFLCRLLGIEESAGLTLMLLKRAREAVYNSVGLLVLTRAGYAFFPETPSRPDPQPTRRPG